MLMTVCQPEKGLCGAKTRAGKLWVERGVGASDLAMRNPSRLPAAYINNSVEAVGKVFWAKFTLIFCLKIAKKG
jgi:hypothetical protein